MQTWFISSLVTFDLGQLLFLSLRFLKGANCTRPWRLVRTEWNLVPSELFSGFSTWSEPPVLDIGGGWLGWLCHELLCLPVMPKVFYLSLAGSVGRGSWFMKKPRVWGHHALWVRHPQAQFSPSVITPPAHVACHRLVGELTEELRIKVFLKSRNEHIWKRTISVLDVVWSSSRREVHRAVMVMADLFLTNSQPSTTSVCRRAPHCQPWLSASSLLSRCHHFLDIKRNIKNQERWLKIITNTSTS